MSQTTHSHLFICDIFFLIRYKNIPFRFHKRMTQHTEKQNYFEEAERKMEFSYEWILLSISICSISFFFFFIINDKLMMI